jgi:hypothetical protein
VKEKAAVSLGKFEHLYLIWQTAAFSFLNPRPKKGVIPKESTAYKSQATGKFQLKVDE